MKLSKENRLGVNVLALVGLFVALHWGAIFFIPVVIAALLAGFLWPVVNWCNHRLKMPWSGAVLFVMSVVLAVVALTGTYAITEGTKWVRVLNDEQTQRETYQNIQAAAEKAMTTPTPDDDLEAKRKRDEFMKGVGLPQKHEESSLYQYLRNPPGSEYVVGSLLKVGVTANSVLWQGVLVLFVTLFLLLEGRTLTRRVAELFGRSDAQSESFDAMAKMGEAVRSYIVWRTVINAGLAVVVGAVFWAMGLKFWFVWALLLFVLNYIPFLGAIVAALPPIVDAFATPGGGLLGVPGGIGLALGAIAFYTLIVVVEGYIIVPLVMGRGMELNATTVMLACMFWDLIWGVPGLFLAMPIMAAVRAACEHLPGGKPWARLMATEGAELIPADVENKLRALGAKGETADDIALVNPAPAPAAPTELATTIKRE